MQKLSDRKEDLLFLVEKLKKTATLSKIIELNQATSTSIPNDRQIISILLSEMVKEGILTTETKYKNKIYSLASEVKVDKEPKQPEVDKVKQPKEEFKIPEIDKEELKLAIDTLMKDYFFTTEILTLLEDISSDLTPKEIDRLDEKQDILQVLCGFEGIKPDLRDKIRFLFDMYIRGNV